MSIEKVITPFIESQFPQFYKEEGPLFIEFMKAYYSWLETQGNIIHEARSLPEYRDIDTTPERFLTYFKNKYINALPENILVDKKLLEKHILDLYRSKGTDRSYALLFKIFFNEDIDFYYPGKDIFKLSDGDWVVPKYIEVSSSQFLYQLIGNKIYSSSNLSTATVENYFTKSVNNKLINVLILSNIEGNFRYGEHILCEAVPEMVPSNAPFIYGSLSSIGITDGGLGYNVGDLLDVKENGLGGLARVVATTARNGQVTFDLVDGGEGFSLDALVNVTGDIHDIKTISNTNPVVVETIQKHGLGDNQTVRIDYAAGMLDVNVGNYEYYVKVINSTAFSLYTGYGLSNSVNGTTWEGHTSNTGYVFENPGGAGASFQIGSLVNKEIYRLNTDIISDYIQAILCSRVAGYNITISNTNGTFSIDDTISVPNTTVLPLDVEVLTIFSTNPREKLVNNAVGVANLTIESSDFTYVTVKGDINNANITIDTVLAVYKDVIANTAYVDSTADTLKIERASETFAVGDRVVYQVPDGNTPVSGLVANQIYYVSFANSTDIALANTETGPNLNISSALTSAGQFHKLISQKAAIKINTIFPIMNVYSNATIVDANSSVLSVNSQSGYFGLDTTLTSNTGATAKVERIERLTDWMFPAATLFPDVENLDTPIGLALTYVDKEVGTIASLTNINTGEGYSKDPIVTVIEPLIYDLRMLGVNGGFKGFNAVVNAAAGFANGVVTAIEIVDSGYGYDRDRMVSLISNTNPYAVKGTTVIDTNGISKGYWKDNKSFLSDLIYIQDSDYYQKFSYEIISSKMIEVYEKYVKELVHPTGMKLFGRYVVNSKFDLEESIIAQNEFQSKYATFNAELDVSNTTNFIRLTDHTFANGEYVTYHIIDEENFVGYRTYSATFNSNTEVDSETGSFVLPDHKFVNNDLILYKIPAGSIPVTGLVDNTLYYVVESNTSSIRLSSSYAGDPINIYALTNSYIHELRLKIPTPIEGLENHESYFITAANTSGVKLANTKNGPVIPIKSGFGEIHSLYKLNVG